MELPRHDGARASGGVGGLAGGLPAEPTVQVVELARELRPRRRARPEVGRGVGRRRGRLSETRRLVRRGIAHAEVSIEALRCAARWSSSLRNETGYRWHCHDEYG